MIDLSTKYMGFDLQSPLILGSCGISNNVEKLKEAEQCGFGAVVIKSIFEEQIYSEIDKALSTSDMSDFSKGAYDYITQYQEIASFEKYLDLVRRASAALSIPVIASVNCFSNSGWVKYAKAIQDAGASALEVNYFILPTDFNKTADSYTDDYIKLITELKRSVSIPIALKTSSYFTDLAHFMQKLSYTGIAALVLFNRFYAPDIDIEKMEVTYSNNLSHHEELANTLRWVGILSEKIRCDLSATTGVHDYKGMAKLILAGADTVQAASVFYHKGIKYGETMLHELKEWMSRKGFNSVSDFKAKMNYVNLENPNTYFRIQFMKYMAGIE